MDALASFHPAVRGWFERSFPAGPTAPQARGWPTIAEGRDTLIAAPTGSGKTLSAFLVCIDRLVRASEARLAADGLGDPEPRRTEVVYISPLKALAADIHENLEKPISGIQAMARELGLPVPEVYAALRTGDTPASQRARMLRRPPQLLITTPESLYLMLTAERSREMLRGVRTVIVDEIHAVARDKRGSHLSVSLERLERLSDHRPVRIGLSATQRPIQTVSRLLVGAGPDRSDADGSPRCMVVDEGHQRELDLGLELPEGELEAVASAEQVADVLDKIAEHVKTRRTTLVFVNTRRMAERLAHLLAERLGDEAVAAHHGSLSRERRLRVEARLRSGSLKALVATASLELGIDVGPIDLVCQIGSPRSLATFIQRVGRSGHCLGGTPTGRLYPLTRDELVECAALLRGVKAGHMDALHPPVAPLDILAQQIVAACAAEDWKEDELFALMRGAAPFAELARADFEEIVDMLSEGITTGRGRRGAYLHRDRVNGTLRGRRGARLAAITSGGAIPETGDYRVLAEPDDSLVGTVGEDWAIESMAGDIFLLGSTSWQIRRVQNGIVRVADAKGAPPTVPFWVGEAPARSNELSIEVSELRARVATFLANEDAAGASTWVAEACGLEADVADQLVDYLKAAYAALGALPTREEIVFERFFDESGGMQLVVHSPFGGRLNRGFGLALRKRFCKTFDFELQAAANDDAIVLSLGPQHSFPLQDVPRFLHSGSVAPVLSQAVLDSPMFAARWRWNLNRSLVVLRSRGGKRNPPPIQRMESDDLMAAVFPGLAACQENATGPIEIPDHPLVNQTLHDCLHEAMDVDALSELLRGIESGRVQTRLLDSTEPSPLSHEILNGRPYTFLDNAPLEERRTRAVSLRRGLPVEARELGRLDPEAIERVREEARPDPRDADELHDVLQSLVVSRPNADCQEHFEALVTAGRACTVYANGVALWCASERRRAVALMFPTAPFVPDTQLPDALRSAALPELETIETDTLQGHMDCCGPIEAVRLGEMTGLEVPRVEAALARLEGVGFALRGSFEEPAEIGEREQFCARRLLTRIHRYTQDRLRSEIEAVTAQDFMRFLLRWQHATPDTRREGRRGALAVIEQLQGFELAAGSWEEALLPSRVDGYRSRWLDELCLSGDVAWGRLSLRSASASTESDAPAEESSARDRGGASPSRATPLSLLLRGDQPWLLRAARGEASAAEPGPGAAKDVLDCLRSRGALFHRDLVSAVGRLPVEVEEGLWDLVARGLVTADGFGAVRSLLEARKRWARRTANRRARRGLRRGIAGGVGSGSEGRWGLLPDANSGDDAASEDLHDRDGLAEAVAEQLLARWGVVFRDLLARESLAVPWRDLLWAFRRLEARGTIRGGRFVSGFVGEQYALPEAVDSLRRMRRTESKGEVVRLSATDPLNLVGILTPGPRVPALRSNRVAFRDGLPIEVDEGDGAARPAEATLH